MQYFGKVVFGNPEHETYNDFGIENHPTIAFNAFVFLSIGDLQIYNMNLTGFTGTSTDNINLFNLINFESTNTIFDKIQVDNSYFGAVSLISVVNPLELITIKNMKFEAITMDSQSSLITINTINSVQIKDLMFENISVSDPTDDTTTLLFITTIDLSNTLNSSIADVSISQSHSSFLVINSLSGETNDTKKLDVSNVTIKDTHFTSNRNLITTQGIETSSDFTINFSHLNFTGISFENKGQILNFNHFLNSAVTVTDSTFTNIESASVRVESSSDHTLGFVTRVHFES